MEASDDNGDNVPLDPAVARAFAVDCRSAIEAVQDSDGIKPVLLFRGYAEANLAILSGNFDLTGSRDAVLRIRCFATAIGARSVTLVCQGTASWVDGNSGLPLPHDENLHVLAVTMVYRHDERVRCVAEHWRIKTEGGKLRVGPSMKDNDGVSLCGGLCSCHMSELILAKRPDAAKRALALMTMPPELQEFLGVSPVGARPTVH